MRDLFAILERDWDDRWQHCPAEDITADTATVGELVDVANRRTSAAVSDGVLAGLAERAACDDLAARTLLQALLPGLRAIARDHRALSAAEDVAATTVALAWEHIRRYSVSRRPAHIAANILRDTAHHLRATYRVVPVAEAVLRSTSDESSSGDELLAVTLEAVDCGHVTAAEASLILRYRILGVSLRELADELGMSPSAVSRRRSNAEAKLGGDR